jgi:hypothetical protein
VFQLLHASLLIIAMAACRRHRQATACHGISCINLGFAPFPSVGLISTPRRKVVRAEKMMHVIRSWSRAQIGRYCYIVRNTCLTAGGGALDEAVPLDVVGVVGLDVDGKAVERALEGFLGGRVHHAGL